MSGSATSSAAIRWCRLLRAQVPDRPVDIVTSTLCAPLADYMPGVRRADRRRPAPPAAGAGPAARPRRPAARRPVTARRWSCRANGRRRWRPGSPAFPLRTGFAGEARFGLLNDLRWGERKLPRMIDQMGALALPNGAPLPAEWPLPELKVPADEIARLARAARARRRSPAHRHAVAGRGRRRQGLAARPLRRAGAGAGAGRRLGLGAGRAQRDDDRAARSPRPAARACATSPAPICATPSWRWPPPTSRSPTIPG